MSDIDSAVDKIMKAADVYARAVETMYGGGWISIRAELAALVRAELEARVPQGKPDGQEGS